MDRIHNLLFLNTNPIWGGATKNLFELLKKLDKQVFRPILVLPDSDNVIYSEAVKYDIDVELMPMPFLHLSRNPFKSVFFAFKILKANISFLKLIRRLDAGIIICNSIQDSLFIALASKMLKKKLVIYMKNILDKRWKKVFRSKISDFFASKIIAVSNRVREDVIKYMKNPNKTVVIYEGIDIDSFKKDAGKSDVFRDHAGAGKESFKIINVGNISYLKGQKLLVEALSLPEFKNVDFNVFFIGEANYKKDIAYKESIEKFVKENDMSEKVFFPGFRKNVNEYIKYCDLLVHCPVLEEGFGLVILEAFCFGKTVVATSLGGIPEIIEDPVNGFLCPPGSKELAEKIMYVYKDKADLGYIKENAIKTVSERFTLEAQIRKTERLYRELAGL
jgi:glycosyltransferase involved in cell wall biosynthesis